MVLNFLHQPHTIAKTTKAMTPVDVHDLAGSAFSISIGRDLGKVEEDGQRISGRSTRESIIEIIEIIEIDDRLSFTLPTVMI